MKRDDVFWADLDPPYRSEPGKRRPVLVVQTDALTSAGHHSVIVLIITSQVKPQPDPLRVHIPHGGAGLPKPADVVIDQITSRDQSRFRQQIGAVPNSIMAEVDSKLQDVLDLL